MASDGENALHSSQGHETVKEREIQCLGLIDVKSDEPSGMLDYK